MTPSAEGGAPAPSNGGPSQQWFASPARQIGGGAVVMSRRSEQETRAIEGHPMTDAPAPDWADETAARLLTRPEFFAFVQTGKAEFVEMLASALRQAKEADAPAPPSLEEMADRLQGWILGAKGPEGRANLSDEDKEQIRKNFVHTLEAAGVPALLARIEELEAAKNGAYAERDKVVAALAKVFPSGTQPAPDCDTESEPWHIVYIDLPTGQASWHYPASEASLFAGLPPYEGTWDGHTTEEKYERLEALTKKTITG